MYYSLLAEAAVVYIAIERQYTMKNASKVSNCTTWGTYADIVYEKHMH